MTPHVRATVALALALLLTLSGCGGDDGAGPGRGSDPGGSATKDAVTKDRPEPEPVMLGTQRYRMPCQVLTPADVRRVYGAVGAYATYDEEARDRGLDSRTTKQISGTVGGAVKDRCRYSFDDRRKSTLSVEVAQYDTPVLARKAWRRTRSLGTGKISKKLSRQSAEQWLIDLVKSNEADLGGVPVPGLDASVLYVKNYGQFVGLRGSTVLSVERKDYAGGDPFSPTTIGGDLRRIRQVFAALYAHVDDPDLDQSPAPAYWQQSPGWPTFVDPCRVFDDDVMAAGTRRRSYRGEFASSSTFLSPATRRRRNDSPAFQAVSNDCERTARNDPRPGKLARTHVLRGEVWYAAPGTTGRQLLAGLPVRKLFRVEDQRKYSVQTLIKAKVLRAVEVPGADAAYLFDYRRAGVGRVGWLMAVRGDRLVYVDPEQPARKKREGAFLDNDPVPQDRMVSAAAKALENLEAQSG